MIRIFFFLLISIFFLELSAKETVNQKYEKASVTGRDILVAKTVEIRKDLYNGMRHKYAFIPEVWGHIPTYDITHKYTPYIQKYKLSCEIAATKMVMNSFGENVSENDIIFRIPIFSGALGTGTIWGNPDKEFVGDIHGSQYMKTGYGIYEPPLAQYLEKRGFKIKIMNAFLYEKGMSANRHLNMLFENIENGNRVILWGDYCTTPSEEDGILRDDNYKTLLKLFPIAAKNHCDRKSDDRIFLWKTKEDIEIHGLSGEHAFLLLGFIGDIKRPSHIIVWDTATGRHIFSYEEWMRKWSLLHFRSLIVSDNTL